MSIPPSTRTRLEKMANDNGFDLPVEDQGDWLLIHSSRVPLRMWLSVRGGSVYLAALSQLHVARALSEHGNELTNPIPKGACAVRTVSDLLSLHRLVRRAFQLSSTLPDELLHTFLRKTESLPRQTEVERLVVQRIGQDVFRQGLLDFWEGRCAVTGLAIPEEHERHSPYEPVRPATGPARGAEIARFPLARALRCRGVIGPSRT